MANATTPSDSGRLMTGQPGLGFGRAASCAGMPKEKSFSGPKRNHIGRHQEEATASSGCATDTSGGERAVNRGKLEASGIGAMRVGREVDESSSDNLGPDGGVQRSAALGGSEAEASGRRQGVEKSGSLKRRRRKRKGRRRGRFRGAGLEEKELPLAGEDGRLQYVFRCLGWRRIFEELGRDPDYLPRIEIDEQQRRGPAKPASQFSASNRLTSSHHSIIVSVSLLLLLCLVSPIAQAAGSTSGANISSSSANHLSGSLDSRNSGEPFNRRQHLAHHAADDNNSSGQQPDSILGTSSNNNNLAAAEAQTRRRRQQAAPTTMATEANQKLMFVNRRMTSDISEVAASGSSAENSAGPAPRRATQDGPAAVNEAPPLGQVTDDESEEELEVDESWPEIGTDKAAEEASRQVSGDGSSIIVSDADGNSSSNNNNDDYNDYGVYVVYDTSHSNSSSNNNNNNLPATLALASGPNGPAESMADSSDVGRSAPASSASFQVIFFAAMPPYKLTTTSTQSPQQSSLAGSQLAPVSTNAPQPTASLANNNSGGGLLSAPEVGSPRAAQVANDSFKTQRPQPRPSDDEPSSWGDLAPATNWPLRAEPEASRGPNSGSQSGEQPSSAHHRTHRLRRTKQAPPAKTESNGPQLAVQLAGSFEAPAELDEDDVKWLRNMDAARGSTGANDGDGPAGRDGSWLPPTSGELAARRRGAKEGASGATLLDPPTGQIPSSSPPTATGQKENYAEPNQVSNQAEAEEQEEDGSRPAAEGGGSGPNQALHGPASGSAGRPTAKAGINSSSNNNNQNNGSYSSFPACESAQEKHNVYYWRLIWFILPLGATFGNLLVIMAVYRERSLQSVTNYFIVSLAFADLFVGLIVMPFAVYVLVNEVWELSDTICDIYVAVDVTSSTASILNLVAISIDRYRAVAYPIAYTAGSSSTIAILTICGVWLISCAVGAPIIFGLNTTPGRKSNLCILYNSTFIFWSSLASFYIPCIAMIALYWRIFSAIRSRTKKAIQAGNGAAAATAANNHRPANPTVGPKAAPLATAAAAAAMAVGSQVARPIGPPASAGNKRVTLVKVSSGKMAAASRAGGSDQLMGGARGAGEGTPLGANLGRPAAGAPPGEATGAANPDHRPAANSFQARDGGQPNGRSSPAGDGASGAQSITGQPGGGPRVASETRAAAEPIGSCLTDRLSWPLSATGSLLPCCPMNLGGSRAGAGLELANVAQLLGELKTTSDSDEAQDDGAREEREIGRDIRGDRSRPPATGREGDKVIELSWTGEDNNTKSAAELKLALLKVEFCSCPRNHTPERHQQQQQQPQGRPSATGSEISETNCQRRFLSRLAKCRRAIDHGEKAGENSLSGHGDYRLVGACLALIMQSKRLHLETQFSPSSTSSLSLARPQKTDGNQLKDNGETDPKASTLKPLGQLMQLTSTDQIFINARLCSSPSSVSDVAQAKPETTRTLRLLSGRVSVLGSSWSAGSRDQQQAQMGSRGSHPDSANSRNALVSATLQLHWRLCHELVLTAECRSQQSAVIAHLANGDVESQCCLCCGRPFDAAQERLFAEASSQTPLALSLMEPHHVCEPNFQLTRTTILELDAGSGAGEVLADLLVVSLPTGESNATCSAASLAVFAWPSSGIGNEPAANETCRRLKLVRPFKAGADGDSGDTDDGNKSRQPLLCGHCRTNCLVASVAEVRVGPGEPPPTAVRASPPSDRNKLPSKSNNIEATNDSAHTIVRIRPESDAKPDPECLHLSLLLKEEQRQAKLTISSHQHQPGNDTRRPDVDGSGSESASEDLDEDGSRSDNGASSTSSVSTNFPLGSSSGSSTNEFECSMGNEFGGGQNSCSRRSCCRPMPSCRACQLVDGGREHATRAPSSDRMWNRISLDAKKGASSGGGGGWRSSAGTCGCATVGSKSDSMDIRQLAPAARNSRDGQPNESSANSAQSSDISAARKPIQSVVLIPNSSAKKLEQQQHHQRPTDKPSAQSVNVIQTATEQIKRRSMRLGQLIRGTGGFRSARANNSAIVSNSDKTTFNNNNNNSLTNSDEDPYSSSANVPGTTSGLYNRSGMLNATSTAEMGQVASVSTVVGSKATCLAAHNQANLLPAIGAGSKQKVSLNYSVNFTTTDSGRPDQQQQPSIDMPTTDSTTSNNNNSKAAASGKHSYLVSKVIRLMQAPSNRAGGQKSADHERKHGNGPAKGSKCAKKEASVVAGAQAGRHRAGGSRRRREKNAARRERKATKTLAIVLGIFLICWTPFFTCNIIDGICIKLDMDCRPGMMVYLVTSWLGYINSCVNPIIYTIFNMEFRRAFTKILTTRPKCCSDN